MADPIRIEIDGQKHWNCTSKSSEYDAIHAVAGAILAGADEVKVERID